MINIPTKYPATDPRDDQKRLIGSVERYIVVLCLQKTSILNAFTYNSCGISKTTPRVCPRLQLASRSPKLDEYVEQITRDRKLQEVCLSVPIYETASLQSMTASTADNHAKIWNDKKPDIKIAAAVQNSSTYVRHRQSRLPWLDGKSMSSGITERKRKSSLPLVPGMFEDYEKNDSDGSKHNEIPENNQPVIKYQSSEASNVATSLDTEAKPSLTALHDKPLHSKENTGGADQAGAEHLNFSNFLSVHPMRVKTEHISPRGTFHDEVGETDPIINAYRKSIAGMEILLDEAIRLAQEATDQNLSREVPIILHEATEALRKVSEVRLAAPNGVSRSPSSSETSESSCDHSISSGSSLKSHNSAHKSETKGNNAEHLKRQSSDSTCNTPPHFYKASHDSIAVDWAYADQILKPERAQSSARDQVNLTLRPSPTKEQVRDHIKEKGKPPILPRSSSLKPHHIGATHERPSERSNLRIRSPTEVELPFDPHRSSLSRTRGYGASPTRGTGDRHNWGRDKYDEKDYETPEALKGRHHLSLRAHQGFSINRHHRRQPVARNWTTSRKRIAAFVACLNTALIGIIIGIYAGEVPAIQYSLTDEKHYVILGNVFLYLGLAITTILFWPLPLLHGRKPYTLTALAIALPLQFPQAVVVLEQRSPDDSGYRSGLLLSRACLGLVLGFANLNFKTTLLDLFGASLQSEQPHQEVVIIDDVRRHGGGMGMWLGIWTWCFIGSLAVGFMIGASIISELNVAWGFYITVILIAATLVLGLLSPETRRAPHRRVMQDVELPNEQISRRVARGEIRMHVYGDGPRYWFEEVNAGIHLSFKMLSQLGFAVLSLYQGWIYAEIVLIVIVLGNLLSVDYRWHSEYVGLGVSSIAVGAFLAIPLSKANFFSRARNQGPRTDSMTFQPRVSRSSHLVRRITFMTALPLCTMGYTIVSKGPSVHFMAPITFAGAIGFLSNLAITECHGLMMETYDTSDLQPGVNSKHRLQSIASTTRRRRTNFTSYPRVSAGIFISQTIGFFFAAAATGVGGRVTRHLGAQKATAIVASILMLLTILLTLVLWRFKEVQVVPNELFGRYFGSVGTMRASVGTVDSAQSWRAVVIGNPSGKMRRMSMLELGGLSRWTEVRRLNRLLTRNTTKALNEGWH